jgi:hypothetical protein
MKKFKVIAISEDTNSLGLKQALIIAQDGMAYRVCANSVNMPEEDSYIHIPFVKDKDDNPTEALSFAQRGFELNERVSDVPMDVVNEIFDTK